MSAVVGVLYVPCDGAPELRRILDQLSVLQHLVGGYIETISGNGWTAVLNDEGKLRGLPVNPRATQLARTLGWDRDTTDVLVGPVLFTGAADLDTGALTDVPASVLDAVHQIGIILGGAGS